MLNKRFNNATLIALSAALSGCTAAMHPPTTAAKEVAPHTPHLWPTDEIAASPIGQAKTDNAQVRLGVDNGIIAIVNDRIVTLSEFDYYFLSELRASPAGTSAEQMYKDVMDGLVMRLLFLQKANEDEAKVEDYEIDRRINQVIARYPGGLAAYQNRLGEMQQSLEEIKDEIRDNLIIERVRRRLFAGMAEVTPSQAREYYQENSDQYSLPESRDASLLLIFKGPGASLKARIAKRELNSDDAHFESLVRQHSEGPLATNGGWREKVRREDLAPEIAQTLFKLKPGTHSPLREFSQGWYAVHCENIHPSGLQPFEDVQAEISSKLREANFKRNSAKVLKQLMRDSYVAPLDPTQYLNYRRSKR
jgi:parvulin-like peptidyl-prolyl isomerase